VTTIVVGYVAKPEGEAALQKALEEATLRGGRLVLVSAQRSEEPVVTTIVVGYVAKPEGEAALQKALEEATLRGGRLVLVSAQRSAGDGEAELVGARETLAASGIEHEVRVTTGSFEPAEDLLAVAEELGAGLIVIGLRRRTPVGKLLLGSNAQRILLDAQAPVLAVKVP